MATTFDFVGVALSASASASATSFPNANVRASASERESATERVAVWTRASRSASDDDVAEADPLRCRWSGR